MSFHEKFSVTAEAGRGQPAARLPPLGSPAHTEGGNTVAGLCERLHRAKRPDFSDSWTWGLPPPFCPPRRRGLADDSDHSLRSSAGMAVGCAGCSVYVPSWLPSSHPRRGRAPTGRKDLSTDRDRGCAALESEASSAMATSGLSSGCLTVIVGAPGTEGPRGPGSSVWLRSIVWMCACTSPVVFQACLKTVTDGPLTDSGV